MVSEEIVVGDEVANLLFEIARQIVVLKQDTVLGSLMPALGLALGLRVQRRPANLIHTAIMQPFGLVVSNAGRTIVAEQPRLVNDLGRLDACGPEGHGQGVGDVASLHNRAQLPGDDVAAEVIERRGQLRVSGILCGRPVSSLTLETLAEHDGKLGPGLKPFARSPSPVFARVVENKI